MQCKNDRCKKEFTPRLPWQKFCSSACGNNFWYRQRWAKEHHKIQELSTEIAALKKALERKNSKANQP